MSLFYSMGCEQHASMLQRGVSWKPFPIKLISFHARWEISIYSSIECFVNNLDGIFFSSSLSLVLHLFSCSFHTWKSAFKDKSLWFSFVTMLQHYVNNHPLFMWLSLKMMQDLREHFLQTNTNISETWPSRSSCL